MLTKPKAPTIAALLRTQAQALGSRTVYRSMANGVDETRSVTFAELESQARAVAACLQQRASFGDRALILAEEPIEFIRAFMGCQLAGVIAVPVSPPFPSQRGRRVETLRAIAANCGAGTVLSDWEPEFQARVEAVAPELADRHWIAVDEVTDDDAADYKPQAVSADDIAFLQFTSGSTSLPKGVVVTNDMVMHNQAYIERGLAWTADDVIVNWMPLFHDMGLIGSVLPTLYNGGECVCMSPAAFAKRPLDWLRALSRYRATIGVSPDSGWGLCIEKTTPQERATLDLRSWRLAGNGAEPVSSATLDAFVEAFAPSGFKPSNWFVTYGLAECTLMTTGPLPGTGATRLGVDAAELLEGRVVAGDDRIIVGCGKPTMHRRIEIVDPGTCRPVGEGVIGEIWIAGPDVARHYWERPEESARTFDATLAGNGDGPFMRSGDLGFVLGEELFVAGRLKDVIIVGGRNHYPHDIEATVASVDAPLVTGACATFSIQRNDREAVVVVAEMLPARSRLGVDVEDVAREIRSVIASEHGIPAEVALVDRKSVPKTSSGKLQRAACRASFERGELSRADSYDLQGNVVEPPSADERRRELRRVLVEQIERVLSMPAGEFDTSAAFQDSGMDSLKAAELRERLEEALGERLSPTMFFAHPTTDLLVEQLLDQMVPPDPTAGSAAEPPPVAVSPTAPGPLERDPDELDERELAAALADEIDAIREGARAMSSSAADAHRSLLEGAVRQLRAARGRLEAVEAERHEPLAVTGAGIRLPGGIEDLDGFWDLLRDGTDAVSTQQMSPDGRRTPAPRAAIDGPWAAQLANVESSDAEFFGLGDLEARHMDPQQRLVMEVAWEAIEDAGLPIEELPSNTGVFLGIYGTDYLTLQQHDPAAINAYTGPGGALSIAANRLSYLLDLHGPSMAVDTACSSSLVAVHLACRALRAGDCDVALVGGVNIMVSPVSTHIVEKVLPLSPTGRCRSFDASADGIVRGEGCAMLVLQRASVARSAGRRIRGLIRGTAVNQDGRSNGLTAPNPQAQSALHRSALADAAADPADVVYVEAHGTGTRLGDPIEARALTEVYGPGTVPCAMGSVKANLGHLEAAAGIVGLVKAMLALEHGYAPPHLHLHTLNPEIELGGTRLHVPTELTALPETMTAPLATVSSFGFGGTNAHAVLQAVPPAAVASTPAIAADDPLLLAISARSRAALAELACRYGDLLESAGAGAAADICAAAALQRTHHLHRVAVAADDRDALVARLRAVAPAPLRRRIASGPRVAFVFSGQGCQWTGMGRELLEHEPVVRDEVAACDEIVRELAGWSVAEQLSADDGESRLHETEVAQVAIGTLQLGLAALWRARGVEPVAVTGHSMGEIVAACVAGALEQAQALELLVRRGRISERAARGGAMVSIELAVADVEPLLAVAGDGRVAIAAVNGPRSTVVSGDPASVELVAKAAAATGARSRRLLVEYGFHSPLLDGCDGELAAGLGSMHPHETALTLYSTVTGGRLHPQRLDGAHWGRNLRDAVLLQPAIDAMAADGVSVFVEVGPHPVLLRDIGETLEARGCRATAVGSLRRDRPARSALAASLADVYEAGATIRWDAVVTAPREHVDLPAYPWQRKRHWLPDSTTSATASAAASDAAAPVARVLHIARVPAPPEPAQPRSRAQISDYTTYVRERVAAAAALDIEDVPPDIMLETLELSSLSIVELRNQVERELGIVVPLAALLGGGTPVDLAGAITEAIAAAAADGDAAAKQGRA